MEPAEFHQKAMISMNPGFEPMLMDLEKLFVIYYQIVNKNKDVRKTNCLVNPYRIRVSQTTWS